MTGTVDIRTVQVAGQDLRVAIMGVARASKLARCGKIISAIKYIEEANPEISRERAKWIVYSFGYNGESRWPELERWPERNRLPVRCL